MSDDTRPTSLRPIARHRILARRAVHPLRLEMSRRAVVRAVHDNLSYAAAGATLDRDLARIILNGVLSTGDPRLLMRLIDSPSGLEPRCFEQALGAALERRTEQERFLSVEMVQSIHDCALRWLPTRIGSRAFRGRVAQHAIVAGDAELFRKIGPERADLGSSNGLTRFWLLRFCEVLHRCHPAVAGLLADYLLAARRNALFSGTVQGSFLPTAHHLMLLKIMEVPITDRVAARAADRTYHWLTGFLSTSAHGALRRSQLPEMALETVLATRPAALRARIEATAAQAA